MILKLLSPNFFIKISRELLPFLSLLFPLTLAAGLYYALIASPEDYRQGEMVRVMYVHVPAAWMSLAIYCFMAFCGFSSIVWQTRMAYVLALAAAPIGATFALITLVTGSLWGKPIWGTWWVWDARLTSMLILFFLYICFIIVSKSSDNILRAEKPASVLALVGVINIPIIKFSVNIWYSLHQPASIIRLGGPAIHHLMMKPLFIVFISFILFFVLVLILRTLTLLERIRRYN